MSQVENNKKRKQRDHVVKDRKTSKKIRVTKKSEEEKKPKQLVPVVGGKVIQSVGSDRYVGYILSVSPKMDIIEVDLHIHGDLTKEECAKKSGCGIRCKKNRAAGGYGELNYNSNSYKHTSKYRHLSTVYLLPEGINLKTKLDPCF